MRGVCTASRGALAPGRIRRDAWKSTTKLCRRSVAVRAAAGTKTATKVEKARLGSSGLEVDRLCIGAWSWNDRSGYWGQNSHGGYTEADLREAYQALLDNDLTFIDTAEIYGFGASESFIGEQTQILGRQPVQIATKFAPLPFRITADSVVNTLKASLRRLQTDQVDLYQIHWPYIPLPFLNDKATNAYVEGLGRAQIAGLAKAVGVSNFKASRVRTANRILADQGVPLASNQVQWSLLYRQPERNGVLEACRETDTALLAYSPLAQGLLSGKYTLDKKPGGPRAAAFSDDRIRRIQPLLGLLREIGQGQGKTPAQVAVNWVVSKGEAEGVTAIPILGVKTRQQAEEARGVLGWRLSAEELRSLDRASTVLQNTSVGAPFEKW